jgi:hypothetical protein
VKLGQSKPSNLAVGQPTFASCHKVSCVLIEGMYEVTTTFKGDTASVTCRQSDTGRVFMSPIGGTMTGSTVCPDARAICQTVDMGCPSTDNGGCDGMTNVDGGRAGTCQTDKTCSCAEERTGRECAIRSCPVPLGPYNFNSSLFAITGTSIEGASTVTETMCDHSTNPSESQGYCPGIHDAPPTTGLCVCHSGFEGDACEKKVCPICARNATGGHSPVTVHVAAYHGDMYVQRRPGG